MYKLVHTIIGSLFFIGALFFLAHSLGGITGFSVIEDFGPEKSSALGSILLLGAAIIFRLGLRPIRKGQAAMEFLMTYGWTILAVILVLGTLGYFSFFNSEKLLPDTTLLQSPFYAIAGSADEDSINLGIQNNGDQTYTITDITIPNCGSYTDPFYVEPGEVADVSVQCEDPLTVNTRFRGDIGITYRAPGSTVDRNIGGDINSNVQPGVGIRLSPGNPVAVCGNNIIEGNEVCDGTNTGSLTDCTDLEVHCPTMNVCPFVGPTLACETDCSGFDIDACQHTECSDGIDNDLNGQIDWPSDVGCTTANDNDETILPQEAEPVACEDGEDNDGDLFLDYPDDPGCTSQFDGDELGITQCDDGVDNDGDTNIDYPLDLQCTEPLDDKEIYQIGGVEDGEGV